MIKQIFSALASRGRSSLATIAQLTRIPPSRIRVGLALLIQHHIIKYYDPDDDDPRIPTFYHADLDATYNLIRSHKYVRIVSEREGEAAGKLLANIFELGHASVGDLENAYELTPASKRDSGIDTVEQHMTEEGMINGISKDDKHETSAYITSIAEFHSLIRKLLDEGYLVKVNERSYMPQVEYEAEARQATIEESEDFQDGKISGAKKQRQFDAELNTLKRKWEDEDSYSKTRDIASKGSIKRAKSSAQSNKRVKINGDLPNGTHHEIIDDCKDVEECVPKLPVYATAREFHLRTCPLISIRMTCLFVSTSLRAPCSYATSVLSRWLTTTLVM
jgi:DNA-directed RNA polymerase III subunit RPC3